MYDRLMAPSPTARRVPTAGTVLAVVGAVADLALAAGLGVLRATNSSVGLRHAEGHLPTLALVIVLAAPGAAALLGVAIARPVLFGAAGFACFPLAVVSVAAVPIWLPGVLFLIAFVRASATRPPAPLLGGTVLVGFTALLLVALRILVTGNGHYTYSYPGGSEGGDYFLPGHATFCILIVVADLVLATVLARLSPSPARHSHAAASNTPERL
jgi:hypothetical protein